MAIEIVMPRFGWTMEEGVLAEWLKKDGDTVQPGDLLFTVESDKALNEVEAFDAGILRIPPDAPPPGATIPVGGLLAYLMQPGEALPGAAPQVAAVMDGEEHGDAPPLVAPVTANGTATATRNTPTISPRAKRIAAELAVDWTTLTGSGRTGRIIEHDVRNAAQRTQLTARANTARVTPLARRVADDLGVDVNGLAEQNPDKRRIARADVENVVRREPTPPPASVASDTATPMNPMRRRIAERMATSAHTTAPVTLTTEADVTELVRLRKQIKADAGKDARAVPSYTDLLVKLCAEALSEHPALNARLEDDSIIEASAIHIGIAVDADRGLFVPVLRDVQNKNLRRITQESAALIAQARAGQLTAGAMQGGTFTITNLGMFEIDAFTPIINLPECAILGVGRIVAKQIVTDADAETLAIRQMMFLSLTFDHRLVDGAYAARFLRRVKHFTEQPYLWLA